MDRFYDENNDVLAIFFDLDNTLIQTRKGDSKACNKVSDFFLYFDIAISPRSWEVGMKYEVSARAVIVRFYVVGNFVLHRLHPRV